jgi:hypothetical protein
MPSIALIVVESMATLRGVWFVPAIDREKTDSRIEIGTRLADLAVYAAILSLSVLQIALVRRLPDFITGDVTYYELARSIIEGRAYGFNGRLETMLPPGFPALLALLSVTVGSSYNVLIRAMPVFAGLGFIASYELLRREVGRGVAAVICIVLMSSGEVFAFSTSLVFSDLPYFFTSSLSLLLVALLEQAGGCRGRAVKSLLLCILLPASIMTRSAGLALLAGLAAWLATSRPTLPGAPASRIRTLLLPLFLGIFVQAVWMWWGHRHEVSEWPIGGYPKSYLSQLLIKSGNQPELGMATLSDVGARVLHNSVERATNVVELLCRRWLAREWSSPPVFGTITLVLVGVTDAIRRRRAFHDWYFLGHEAMYLLWPWEFEERFFLPVIPLTCLYLWRGGQVLVRFARRAPRAFGWGLLPLAVVLGAGSVAWWRSGGGRQASLSLVFWGIAAALAAWAALTERHGVPPRIAAWARRTLRIASMDLGLLQALGIAGIAALVGWGLVDQVRIGEKNVHLDLTQTASYPAIQAATWIRTHSPETAVVMARELDVVYHHSGRRVVWFPPTSDPAVLLQGIRRYKVDLIIVTDGRFAYWRPTDRSCFDRLRPARPEAFHLVHEERSYQIYAVSEDIAGARPGEMPEARSMIGLKKNRLSLAGGLLRRGAAPGLRPESPMTRQGHDRVLGDPAHQAIPRRSVDVERAAVLQDVVIDIAVAGREQR